MKEITCYDCAKKFKAETSKEMLGLLYDHYMKDHHEIITGVDEAGKKAWMIRFEQDWSKVEEIE